MSGYAARCRFVVRGFSESYPVRPDTGTGRQALRDRLEDQLRFRGDAIKPAKSEAVDDLLATALSGDKPAVAQTCQVGADPRLRLGDGRYQLAHSEVAFVKKLEDVQPSRSRSSSASGSPTLSRRSATSSNRRSQE